MVRDKIWKSEFAAGFSVADRDGKKVGVYLGRHCMVDLGALHFILCKCMYAVSGDNFARVNAWNSIAPKVWLGSVFFSAFRWRWDVSRGEFLLLTFAGWKSLRPH